jgi:PKD repeat protein
MYFYHNTFSNTADGPNSLYPNQGQGFRFNGNATNINLDGNHIANNGNIGLQLGGTNVDRLTIVNNTIIGNAGAAVTRDFSSVGPFAGKDLVWSNNTVANNGNNFQLSSVGFSANAAPTAAIVDPGAAMVGQRVNFSFSFSDKGTLGSVLWDLGEGLPETSANPTHVYTIPGKYRVELVVWDNAGRAAFDTQLVTVAPKL